MEMKHHFIYDYNQRMDNGLKPKYYQKYKKYKWWYASGGSNKPLPIIRLYESDYLTPEEVEGVSGLSKSFRDQTGSLYYGNRETCQPKMEALTNGRCSRYSRIKYKQMDGNLYLCCQKTKDGERMSRLDNSLFYFMARANSTWKDGRVISLKLSNFINVLLLDRVLDANGNALTLPEDIKVAKVLTPDRRLIRNKIIEDDEAVNGWDLMPGQLDQILKWNDERPLPLIYRSVFDTIGGLSQLQELSIFDSYISYLPDNMSQLHHLVKLVLLRLEKFTKLPKWIGELSNLEILQVERCPLETLPNELCQLIKLKRLVIKNAGLDILPDCIGNVSSLETLKLNKNNLSLLPDSIKELRELRYLDLANNKLETIPSSFQSLDKLETLRLNDNRMWKPELLRVSHIPFEHLNYLDVSGNLREGLGRTWEEWPDQMGFLSKQLSMRRRLRPGEYMR